MAPTPVATMAPRLEGGGLAPAHPSTPPAPSRASEPAAVVPSPHLPLLADEEVSEVSGVEELSGAFISSLEEDDQTLPPMSMPPDEETASPVPAGDIGHDLESDEEDTLAPEFLESLDAEAEEATPEGPASAPDLAPVGSAAPASSPLDFADERVPPEAGQGGTQPAPSSPRPSATSTKSPVAPSPGDFGDEPTFIKVPPLSVAAGGRPPPEAGDRARPAPPAGEAPVPVAATAMRASDFEDIPAPGASLVGPPVSEDAEEGPTLAHVPPLVGAPLADEVPDYAITPQAPPVFAASPAAVVAKAPGANVGPEPDDARTPAHQVVPRISSSALAAMKQPGGPTAAELARRRRQLASSRAGQVLLWWRGLPLARKLLTITITLFVLAASSGTLVLAFRSVTGASANGPEPMALGVDPVPDSFGVGEGVKWVHSDEKSFDFQFVAPTRAVALLHYQASGISSEEVSMALNGGNLGWVPPDTLSTSERELEVILPARLLRRGAVNHFVFDNVRNPPGNEAWRVWNLRLEIIPVPELPPEELLSLARDYVATAGRYFETRGVGAENLFRAWQQYRFAWITLEAFDNKPDLYQDVRYRLSQVSAELDHQCAQLMLEFQRGVQFRSARQARAALQEVSRRFPTTEHRCHNLAQEKAFEHEL
ncbi:hypothetical protein LY474_33495 [Myxococcus stipitatus]|uniref:hypothetical protein n=1 Tax=Myxococcus stipitatus TaxID=83455 RepID=UPI001F40D9E0|nr:hypothetical protein [Myxococcus stipitatus]MCE9672733.1 hypothetical protein [Myxococcus stipitatus]